MGLSKRIFIENDPAYEAERVQYQKELSEHIDQFPATLSLIKYCAIEGKRRLDRTWSMAVVLAIEELNLDCISVNRSTCFRNAADRDAAEKLAAEKHPALFKKFGLQAPKRCSHCGKKMRKKLAKRGPSTGTVFWGCSGYPNCRHTENAQK